VDGSALEDLQEEADGRRDDDEGHGDVGGVAEGAGWEDAEVEAEDGDFCEGEGDEVEGFVNIEELAW
jgi:hypothetical protein